MQFQTDKMTTLRKPCRSLIVWAGLMLLLTCANHSLLAADIDKSGPSFKSFLENPPIIERLVCAQEFPDFGHSNLFFLKWQSNAFLLAEMAFSSSPEKTPAVSNYYYNYTTISSKFGDHYWQKTPNSLYYWVDQGNKKDLFPDNQAWYSTGMAQANIPALLCAGFGLVQVGHIHWNDDTFTITNETTQIKVTGKLARDERERVKEMTVSYAGIGANNQNEAGKWVFRYSYSDATNDIPPYYPQYIQAVCEDLKAQATFRMNERFYVLKTSSSSLPESAFALNRYDFKDVIFEFWTTNGSLVISNHVGPNIIAHAAPPKLQELNPHRRALILGSVICIALALLLPLVRQRLLKDS